MGCSLLPPYFPASAAPGGAGSDLFRLLYSACFTTVVYSIDVTSPPNVLINVFRLRPRGFCCTAQKSLIWLILHPRKNNEANPFANDSPRRPLLVRGRTWLRASGLHKTPHLHFSGDSDPKSGTKVQLRINQETNQGQRLLYHYHSCIVWYHV